MPANSALLRYFPLNELPLSILFGDSHRDCYLAILLFH